MNALLADTDTVLYFAATQDARLHVMRQANAQASALVDQALADGEPSRRIRVVVGVAEDDRSLRQNRFYWGYVLKSISQQARIEGKRYVTEAWHELFKRQMLGYEVKKTRVAGRAKPTVYRRLRSTTDLSVPQMSRYLDEVIAFAVTDLSVAFQIKDWQEYQQ